MSVLYYQLAFLVLAFVFANLPWLSQRCLLILQCDSKPTWMRFAEWTILYVLIGIIGWGLENRVMGTVAPQDWEFYAVTLSVFAVFATPGFIYRHIR